MKRKVTRLRKVNKKTKTVMEDLKNQAVLIGITEKAMMNKKVVDRYGDILCTLGELVKGLDEGASEYGYDLDGAVVTTTDECLFYLNVNNGQISLV